MKVVFDTSILVAAARSNQGASYALLARLPDAGFQTVISVALFAEYRAVLLRPENLLQRTAIQAESFLDFLISTSHLQEVFFLWRPAAAILSPTISGISGEWKNGESRRCRRVIS